MPELPEVQTIVDDLKALGVIGSTITRVSVHWPRSIARLTPGDFTKKVCGRTIRHIDRRGKFIRFDLGQELCMAVHLRMTGRFSLVSPNKKHDKHEHVYIGLGRLGQLRFHDTRKFGRFYLLEPDDPFFRRLGPEPLDDDLTAGRFHTMLGRRSRRLKPLLLDQTFIAGLGNIYVDEALWYARIHPLVKSDSLDSKQASKILGAIRKVLRKGLENAGTTLGQGEGNYASMRQGRGKNGGNLKVFRRTGLPCHRCGDPIERIIVGQRSTHLCPRCQPMD
ncbi:MAG: bifunctional DNA-formamidopyrimidine glycosylase/DNA-(apurinic or apyrimidinic site) lyase [Desulfosarcinaceae bacterium]